MLRQNLPNLLTLANLALGCVGLIYILSGQTEISFYCILAAVIFDFLDGTTARLLNAFSPIGKDLDSLADAVSFGVLPGIIAYKLSMNSLEENYQIEANSFFWGVIKWGFILIPLMSVIRLARFNNDIRQKEKFIGLPTPANAIFWGGLCYGISNGQLIYFNHPWFLFSLIVFTSFMLNSGIPMFSLKIQSFSWKKIRIPVLFLVISAPFMLMLGLASASPVIILYIILSAGDFLWERIRRTE